MVPTQILDVIPQHMLSEAETVRYQPGEYLIRPDETVKSFYVLSSGSAKLVHENSNTERIIIDIYHAGDFFGEMEMVDCLTTGRSIIALNECGVYRFNRAQFFALWSSTPAFSEWILRVHCDRLLRAGDDKVYAERAVLREKVFRIIQQHINPRGCFLYTKQTLAEMSGVSVRSLNRTLKELETDKLITVSGGTIRLHMT